MKALVLLSILAVLASAASAAPIATGSGLIDAVQDGAIHVYRGIPYAAAPIGENRWRAPQPHSGWEGVRDANAFSPMCPQEGHYPPEAAAEPMSEDCLTLNIWTPAAGASEKLPVMVWVHGGGLMNGSGSTPLYWGDELAKRGVVIVTFNYRLGALGFLAHPELNAETVHGGSGNYGFLDQIAALTWVQRNIAAFGGDPDRVTVFGQSSGSISISALVASPLAKGLFVRAIGQSGGLFEPLEIDPIFSPSGAAHYGARFAERAGAASLSGLRAMPAAALADIAFRPQFNIDGHALAASPFDAYASGNVNDVDLLVGANQDEGEWFLAGTSVTVDNFNEVLTQTFPGWLVSIIGAKPGNSDAAARASAAAFETDMRFRWNMWAWARYAAAAESGSVYFYQFSKAPPVRNGNRYFGLGATHGMEMPYVFGHFDPQAADWTDKDRALADSIGAYWTNFAKTGNPDADGLPPWRGFDAAPNEVMVLGEKIGSARISDIDRLRRIDRVYSAARFVSAHTNAVIAAAVSVCVLMVAFVAFAVWRLFRRLRS